MRKKRGQKEREVSWRQVYRLTVIAPKRQNAQTSRGRHRGTYSPSDLGLYKETDPALWPVPGARHAKVVGSILATRGIQPARVTDLIEQESRVQCFIRSQQISPWLISILVAGVNPRLAVG
jgi:hypothetical protein